MSDPITGNGQPPETAPGTAQGQQLIINAQYIKDLSFENPRAPQSLMQQAAPPSVEINIDVKAQSIGPDAYEVVPLGYAGTEPDQEPDLTACKINRLRVRNMRHEEAGAERQASHGSCRDEPNIFHDDPPPEIH